MKNKELLKIIESLEATIHGDNDYRSLEEKYKYLYRLGYLKSQLKLLKKRIKRKLF